MDGHYYIPRVAREHTQFFNCQVLNLDNLCFRGQRGYRKYVVSLSNKRTNAAPLGIVHSCLFLLATRSCRDRHEAAT
jgi:hypothetical protein